MEPEVRKEKDIFNELERLCILPGYIHAIAYFCSRDNTIKYVDDMSTENVLQQFSIERLVRTEISTLIGLACKTNLDAQLPSPDVVQKYIDETEALLKELHQSMMAGFYNSFDPSKISDSNYNPFQKGDILRESIFYGGEAAYHFQYKDLSLMKYGSDNDWFIENKGYSVQQADSIVTAIYSIQTRKINEVVSNLPNLKQEDWTTLPAYIFTIEEVSTESGIDETITKALIESFITPAELNQSTFTALDDFNPLNAYPIIKLNDENFLLFQSYSLVEALYETPFFWFNKDASYNHSAVEHRGDFTEYFSEERLKLVFGEKRVFKNIEIYKGKKTRVGEIDVLVIFANRAIVLQAKSKKLTIAARKGNDNCLRDDFKKAVQGAYDQAFSCAEYLTNKEYTLVDSEGNALDISRDFRNIYPFCVVSDHYPALSFQTQQFLKTRESKTIMPPFVMDVFLLDVMTEMLQSPLHFLNYVNKRVLYGDRILSNHELTILSYHLKKNLWFDSKFSMMQLDDDISADLDLAMLARRDNAPGKDTPEGILTRFKETTFGQIISDIDKVDHTEVVDLGFMLLSLGENAADQINKSIEHLTKLYKGDGKHHGISLCIDDGSTGLTIHCNNDAEAVAVANLDGHCKRRKYAQKANGWFGLCINPDNKRMKFSVGFSYDWKQSDKMDEETKDFTKLQSLTSKKDINFTTKVRHGRKVGRNEKCPCGSGKKYKRCCLA